MGKIYDVSMSIELGMQVYKNRVEKQPLFEVTADFDTHGVRETRLSLDLHTGTHIDSPLHMLRGGEGTDSFSLDQLVGDCTVLDLTQVREGIGPEVLEQHPLQKGYFVFFKTRNSFREEFDPDFVYLTAPGARYLAEQGVRGVGIDALGIERNQPKHETHKILFQRKIMVVEGLRLKQVPPGDYGMIVAPLNIKGVEAAPARVFLIKRGVSGVV